MLARAWPAFLAALLLGCAHAPHAAPVPPAGPRATALPPQATEVRSAIGLDFARDVAVNDVTRASFRRALRAEVERHRFDPSDSAFVTAWGFAPPGTIITREATIQGQVDSLRGFYSPHERAIYLGPQGTGPKSASPDEVLVHELVHAAQDDLLPIDRLTEDASGDDERLARRAIIEGHATVATWVVLGAREGLDAERAVGAHEYGALAQGVVVSGGAEIDPSPRDPLLQRVESLFPYTAGAYFMAEVVRAGGWQLASQIFRHPPTTTEQILHPAKYLAGELAVPVAEPTAPPGWHVAAHGRMGELRARAFLTLKLPLERAVSATAGWGGDAFVVVERAAPGRPAVLWSTVWDDEASATRFAAALEEATRCEGAACSWGPVAQRREGRRVAWVRGLEDGGASLASLLALPETSPPSIPPVGRVTLAGDRATALDPLVDPHVSLASVDLRFTVPPEFRPVPAYTVLFAMEDTSHHARASVGTIDGSLAGGMEEQLRASVSAMLVASYPVHFLEKRDVELSLGTGREMVWRFDDPADLGTIRMTFVPICHGQRLLSVMRVARTEETRVALDRWLEGFEPIGPGEAPLCAEPIAE